MAKIIGVRFRNVGKVYYFNPGDLQMKIGDHVIVETSRGLEYGRVVLDPREAEEEKVVHPLKEVCRLATPEDEERAKINSEKEKQAYKICVEKIRAHELDMKLIDVEYAFDNSKILFYFTADGRIDFRLLVKDLASIFKTRIELRQIGVRDETKILGGIGICGRPLCCHSWLTDFVPVSIRMAKEQNLSLNQTKISGVCGRLMCCLKNEQETYEELNKRLPGMGDMVLLPDGTEGTVNSVNVLRQTVKVSVEVNDEKELVEYPVEELKFRPRRKKSKGADRSAEEAQAEEENFQKPERPEKQKGKEPRKGSEGKKENKEARENQENREYREYRDNKDKENRENVENRENKENRETKETRRGDRPRSERRRNRSDRRKGGGQERKETTGKDGSESGKPE